MVGDSRFDRDAAAAAAAKVVGLCLDGDARIEALSSLPDFDGGALERGPVPPTGRRYATACSVSSASACSPLAPLLIAGASLVAATTSSTLGVAAGAATAGTGCAGGLPAGLSATGAAAAGFCSVAAGMPVRKSCDFKACAVEGC